MAFRRFPAIPATMCPAERLAMCAGPFGPSGTAIWRALLARFGGGKAGDATNRRNGTDFYGTSAEQKRGALRVISWAF
jgi:hypothetical protein